MSLKKKLVRAGVKVHAEKLPPGVPEEGEDLEFDKKYEAFWDEINKIQDAYELDTKKAVKTFLEDVSVYAISERGLENYIWDRAKKTLTNRRG